MWRLCRIPWVLLSKSCWSFKHMSNTQYSKSSVIGSKSDLWIIFPSSWVTEPFDLQSFEACLQDHKCVFEHAGVFHYQNPCIQPSPPFWWGQQFFPSTINFNPFKSHHGFEVVAVFANSHEALQHVHIPQSLTVIKFQAPSSKLLLWSSIQLEKVDSHVCKIKEDPTMSMTYKSCHAILHNF